MYSIYYLFLCDSLLNHTWLEYENKVCPVYLFYYLLRTTSNIQRTTRIKSVLFSTQYFSTASLSVMYSVAHNYLRTTRIKSVLFPPSTSLLKVCLSCILWHTITYLRTIENIWHITEKDNTYILELTVPNFLKKFGWRYPEAAISLLLSKMLDWELLV